MDRYSNEKDIEICAVKLHISLHTIIIVTVYRSPTGNIDYFLNNLEEALNHIYNNTVDIILCGDFNINYLNDNQDKQALYSLLTNYSLYSIIDFPTRKFLDRLKYSEIKPMYKKGDKTLIANYRPISLLPVFFQKFLKGYIQDSNNTLVKEQFGFRCNNSTETAIYTLIKNILSSLNDKILVGGLFCDLKKSF
jgi:hypothetical protein